MNTRLKDPALEALNNKHHALLLTGNIFDLSMEEGSDNLFYRPLYLAEKLFEKGYFVLRYSRSSGLTIHRRKEYANPGVLDQVMQRNGLSRHIGNKEIRPTEVVELFRIFRSIAGSIQAQPFAIIVDYASHLVSEHNTDVEMQIAAEAINDIACQPAAQRSGNCLLVYAHHETDLPVLMNSLYKVRYGYPDIAAYRQFFTVMAKRQEEFASTDLSPEKCANLARGLSLMDLAALFKAYKVKNLPVDERVLLEAKKEAIDRVSEGTLNVLPVELRFEDLAGMSGVKRTLLSFAEKLQIQSPTSPRAICVAGPPGTGKTTLAEAMAEACGFNLVSLSDSIKSKWVGASEERLARALQLIESMAPVILFIDEIDQVFQNRTQTSHDGGVSAHYLKTLFQFAAREDLRGKILILGATNTPQLLDPALLSRFITVPVLEANPEELANILPIMCRRIGAVNQLIPGDKNVLQAMEHIYRKGGTPRQLLDILNKAVMEYGNDLHGGHFLEVAKRYRHNGDAISTAYSSLSAIRLTAFEDYFPWYGNEKYELPWYMEGIIDPESKQIDEEKLDRRIAEYQTQAKF